MISTDDILGFIAAGCVLLTFSMKTMRSLRLVALLSNIAFITYAYRTGIVPVLALHALLMPINLIGLLREMPIPEQCRRRLSVCSSPVRFEQSVSSPTTET